MESPLNSTIPTIVIPCHISRTFIQQHPEWIFVYGYDVRQLGADGQAWAFHGEPNSFPVPTLHRYCPSQKTYFNDGAFFSDALYIDNAIDKIAQEAFMSKRPVILCPKIGKGCSRLFEIAPKLYKHLQDRLNVIKYPNITIKYA